MEAASFFCPHPLPTSELPARVSRAAALSLCWHRISICLVKLKVCTAPKSEPAGQRGRGKQRAESTSSRAPASRTTLITPYSSLPPKPH